VAGIVKLIVNGDDVEVAEATSLAAFLLARGHAPERVAAERNGALVRRAERDACLLRDGDVLEVVTLVGGG
jgi:thiamine biosynthesis protein ThiS